MSELVELKAKIEALLYCMPEGITTRALSKYCETESAGQIKKALFELQSEYSERNSGLRVTQQGEFWKFRVRDDLNPTVSAAAEPEFEKAILETLAYIAWKKSILQSDLVKARSTKAYDHVKTLLAMELISSEKSGVSKMLKPTRHFYKYFNIDENQKLDFSALLKAEEDVGAGELDETTAKETNVEEQKSAEEPKQDLSEDSEVVANEAKPNIIEEPAEKTTENKKSENEKNVLVSDWD